MPPISPPLPQYIADWNQLPNFITDREALQRLKQLKAMVEVNRRLIAAVSELDKINQQKFEAAERLASIDNKSPDAQALRQQLWAEMEIANASQKMRTFQCIQEVMVFIDEPR